MKGLRKPTFPLWMLASLPLAQSAVDERPFVNWESPHVHPLDLTPSGETLLAVNTADAVLEVFDAGGSELSHRASIPVGLDPVSVRARSEDEAWVVNHVSDSVSVVDLRSRNVVATLQTEDEPADVVFTERRAFVTCSQANTLLVYELSELRAEPKRLTIRGEDPRALAVSNDGRFVYVGVFESGNRTTMLAGGFRHPSVPDAVGDPSGPYAGQNPPPNRGAAFDPPMRSDLPAPPAVALIVRQGEDGAWRDDNGADWTAFVSGEKAELSGRPRGWHVLDHDLAIVDSRSLDVRYVRSLMNIVSAIAVHPTTGRVAAVGTDARNEVRYLQNLTGRFVRNRIALVDAEGASSTADLNPHLGIEEAGVEQEERERSVSDPRGVAWDALRDRAFVTGMGSNNVVLVGADGARVGTPATVAVGEGPTGVVFDRARDRAFVLNRFGASVSTIDAATAREVRRTAFHDATPPEVALGRRLLNDSHEFSGTGAVSCASCHVDARMDRLAWDLGDPLGDMRTLEAQNLGAGIVGSGVGDLRTGFEDQHPMKGPMVTLTLQDIVGKEPFHWRGDRFGIEDFSDVFVELLGDDAEPDAEAMQRFEDYLATIAYPPNPFRDLDNSLATSVRLPNPVPQESGDPLLFGNAAAGRVNYRPAFMPLNAYCATCHSLPSGAGANQVQDLFELERYHTLPPGPYGELHAALFSFGGGGGDNVTMKGVQLRNLYEKTGFDLRSTESVVGFGFRHDSSVDTLPRLLTDPFDHSMIVADGAGDFTSPQKVADMIAFLLSLSGETKGFHRGFFGRPRGGTPVLSTHAGAGAQLTLDGPPKDAAAERLMQFLALAESEALGLIAKGGPQRRGFLYLGGGRFQADRAGQLVSAEELLESAGPGAELTLTLVPLGTRIRLGVDRDLDGILDGDEGTRRRRP